MERGVELALIETALALWVGTRAITAEVCGDTPATIVPRGAR